MTQNFETHGNPEFLDKSEGVESTFDENTRMEAELLSGLFRSIDKEKTISKITSEDIARLERRTPYAV